MSITYEDITWLEYFIYPAWEHQLDQIAIRAMCKLKDKKLVDMYIKFNQVYFVISDEGIKVLNAYRALVGEKLIGENPYAARYWTDGYTGQENP